MKLSKTAQERCAKKIEAIQNHPFNQELKEGTLAKDKFAYYIEQDGIYLQEASRCLALIASKVPTQYVQQFLSYSNDMFVAEQEFVHNFFKKIFNFQETGMISLATLAYTSFQLSNCALEPVEIAVASMFPGFFIYHHIGSFIAKDATPENPYARWIETYSGDDFSNVVNEITNIFDALAEQTTEAIRERMLDTFSRVLSIEWQFINDCYKNGIL